jgi:hypothetical protein
MVMIPNSPAERALAVDWFINDMTRGRLTIFDAEAMLASLRLVGDVGNLERLSRALSSRGIH